MKKWIYNLLLGIFVAVFLVSAGCLAWYYIDAGRQADRYDQLSQLIETENTRPAIPEEGVQTPPAVPLTTDVTNPKTGQTMAVLKEFGKLYQMNSDLVGWLSIPALHISYPVMQTPDSPDFYLKRNFDKEANAHGCLYARESCDVFTPGDNVTIYGHRMRDGSMFARLDKYMDKSFCQENPYIYFDTLFEKHTYQVVAVFLTTASVGEGFSYHTFENAADEADYADFVAQCKALSLYDTGVDAVYGDKLITLSTCEYSQTNGRLVVVAKRVA